MSILSNCFKGEAVRTVIFGGVPLDIGLYCGQTWLMPSHDNAMLFIGWP